MFREWAFAAVFGFGVRSGGGRPVPEAGPPYKGEGEEGYGEGRDNTVLPSLGGRGYFVVMMSWLGERIPLLAGLGLG